MESNKASSIQTLFNEDLIFDSGLNVPNINASRTYQQMENKTDSDICIKDLFEEFCLCDSVACLDTNNIQSKTKPEEEISTEEMDAIISSLFDFMSCQSLHVQCTSPSTTDWLLCDGQNAIDSRYSTEYTASPISASPQSHTKVVEDAKIDFDNLSVCSILDMRLDLGQLVEYKLIDRLFVDRYGSRYLQSEMNKAKNINYQQILMLIDHIILDKIDLLLI